MKKTVLLSSILLTSIFAFYLKSIATEVGKNIPSSTNQSQNKSNLDNSTNRSCGYPVTFLVLVHIVEV